MEYAILLQKCEVISGEKMSEDNYQRSNVTYKRIEKLKRIGILLLISMPFLIACCILLIVHGNELNKRLDSITAQLEQYEAVILEQQMLVREWQDEMTDQEQALKDYFTAQAILESVSGSDSAEATKHNIITEYAEEPMHKVYLTFDDGPSVYTDEILDILDRYGVKATFFVVGKEDEKSKEALAKIAEAGHTIGLHSYSHDYDKIYGSVEEFAADYNRIQEYVSQATGQTSKFYRFPGGSSTSKSDIDMLEFAEYLAGEGVEFYDWNISSGDGGSVVLDVDTLVKNSTKSISNWKTSIILFHDSADKATTVEALPTIIENILAMEDTVILPITEETRPVHHIDTKDNE